MMHQTLYLGNMQFNLNTEIPIRWNNADENFFHLPHTGLNNNILLPNGNGIFAINFGCSNELIGNEPQTKIADDMYLIDCSDNFRAYQALYLPNHPFYAYSKRSENRVDVTYIPSTMAMESANFCFWILIQLENLLLDNDALILHSCFLENEGEAILFTAPSGTGKTTQGNFWKNTFDAKIVNGDKCMLQRIDGKWYACGFPLHGSAQECENKVVPLKCISIVRQSPEDRIESPSILRKMQLIYSETTVNNWSEPRMNYAMDLIQNLVLQTTVVVQHCTYSDKGARLLHDYLYND